MMRMKTARRQRGECSSPVTTAIGRRSSIGRLERGIAAPRTMMVSSLGFLCCAAAGSSVAEAFANPKLTTTIVSPEGARRGVLTDNRRGHGHGRGGAPLSFVPGGCSVPSPSSRRGVGFALLPAGGVVSATASTTTTTTRLFGSLFQDPDPNKKKDNRNILTKAVDAAKDVGSKILPSVFGTPEERERKVEMQRRRREVSGGLSSLLKDAPLPIRMVGKVLAPLLSNVAEIAREQARELEEVLEEARVLLVSDPAARELLGEPVTVGRPFSQSSSTVSVNGVTRSRVEASFEVLGSRSSGVATVTLSSGGDGGGGIEGLRLNVGGRSISVGIGGGTGGSSGRWIDADAAAGGRRSPSSSGRVDKGNVIDADVIDAEFVEKKK